MTGDAEGASILRTSWDLRVRIPPTRVESMGPRQDRFEVQHDDATGVVALVRPSALGASLWWGQAPGGGSSSAVAPDGPVGTVQVEDGGWALARPDGIVVAHLRDSRVDDAQGRELTGLRRSRVHSSYRLDVTQVSAVVDPLLVLVAIVTMAAA